MDSYWIVFAFIVIIVLLYFVLYRQKKNVKFNLDKNKEHYYYIEERDGITPNRIFNAINNRRYFLKREHAESVS